MLQILFLEVVMIDNWFKYLIIFSNDTFWNQTNLLRRWKSQSIIKEALALSYIEQCGITDIGEPKYRITELGKKIRDN